MTEARERTAFGIPELFPVADAIPAAIVVAAEGRVVVFNRASEVLYGYDRADALGSDLLELLFDPDDRATMAAVLADADGEGLEADRRIRRADGALLVSSFHLVRLDERHVAWIATDTLDQGLAEQERAVLLSAEHAARAEAEAAQRRLSILATASSAMASTLEVDELLDRVTSILAGAVADWCVIVLVDDADRSTHVAVACKDKELAASAAELLRRHPLDHESDDPIAKVIRTGQPRVYTDQESVDRAMRASARGSGDTETFADLGFTSSLLVPVEARGTVRGTIGMAACEGTFTDDDLDLAAEVAHRLALALGNVEAFAHERALAETLQRALLPVLAPVEGVEVAARYLAATDGAEIGGDWYDMIAAGPTSVDCIVGDVAGHDIDAATTMSQLRNTLRAYACLDGATPAETLEQLDRLISRFGLDTATCVMASIDLTDGRLVWSNAGHPPPVLFDGTTATLLADPHDWLLGVMLDDRRRQTACVDLPVGGSLVLYTDGAIERRGIDLDESLERLRVAVERAGADSDAEQICEAVIATMLPTGSARPDDVAILVIRRTAAVAP